MNNDINTEQKHYELANAMPQTLEAFTKMEMDRIVKQLVIGAQDGDTDPAQLYIKLDFIKKALEKAQKEIKEEAIVELQKYDKGQTCMGVEVKIGSRVSYDYSVYEEWTILRDRMKRIEEQMKAAAKLGAEILEGDDIIPPATKVYSADGITATYSKE